MKGKRTFSELFSAQYHYRTLAILTAKYSLQLFVRPSVNVCIALESQREKPRLHSHAQETTLGLGWKKKMFWGQLKPKKQNTFYLFPKDSWPQVWESLCCFKTWRSPPAIPGLLFLKTFQSLLPTEAERFTLKTPSLARTALPLFCSFNLFFPVIGTMHLLISVLLVL